MERFRKKTSNIFEGLFNVDQQNALGNFPGFTRASNIGTQRDPDRFGTLGHGAGRIGEPPANTSSFSSGG